MPLLLLEAEWSAFLFRAAERRETCPKKEEKDKGSKDKDGKDVNVAIDFDGIQDRVVTLTLPARNYLFLAPSQASHVFVAEAIPN